MDNYLIDQNEVQEIFDFLTGTSLPESISINPSHQPKLSPKKAMAVIWFLQEHLAIIDGKFERCERCNRIYDRELSGFHIEKGAVNFVCSNCFQYDPKLQERWNDENMS